MADNKQRAIPVPIQLDGKFYSFRYDFNSLVALEEALGTPEVDFKRLGFKGQRALIWAGLKYGKDAPTIEEVGDMLTPYLHDPKVYAEILEAAAKAYAGAFPEAPETEEEESKKNQPENPGTGT